jgi:hypothetical protein
LICAIRLPHANISILHTNYIITTIVTKYM